MFFVTQGLVEVFNNEADELEKEKPILYLPRFSFFGDFQCLLNIKSTMVYKTMLHKYEYSEDQMLNAKQSQTNTWFMQIEKNALEELCELFPTTQENLKRNAKTRRNGFMMQRNKNSKEFAEKLKTMTEEE